VPIAFAAGESAAAATFAQAPAALTEQNPRSIRWSLRAGQAGLKAAA
jgi:hypothetical protein